MGAPHTRPADAWPSTPAEKAAAVTPSMQSYAPGDLRRYGAKGDGAADDSTALERAFLQAAQPGGATVRVADGTYRMSRDIRTRRADRFEVDAGARIAVDKG